MRRPVGSSLVSSYHKPVVTTKLDTLTNFSKKTGQKSNY
jgi:hypothetical protein